MRNMIGGLAAGAAGLAFLAGCTTGQGMTRTELRVTLTGQQETPGPGDEDGTGTAIVRVDPVAPRVCWTLHARAIEPATAAHIHRGPAGSNGPPVVSLTTPGLDGQSEGCADVTRELASELIYRPHEFYLNVHNADYPGGAIRGQLRPTRIIRER